jgi:hypothetical protein
MVRIPKASESEAEGFKLPANGTYTATIVELGEAQVSAQSGRLQQIFKWELVSMFDDEETEWVAEFEDKGAVVFDYVNLESFYDGGGDPTRVSKLYKIAKALRGPQLNPEDPGDTEDFVGMSAILEIEQGIKTMGANIGKPRVVITAYKHIKRKMPKAKPDTELDIDEVPF